MEEMSHAIQAVSTPIVRVWVNWMMLVFACSAFFAWKHIPARVTLAVFVATLATSLLIFQLTKEPHLIGIGHILLWTPLAWYLTAREITADQFKATTLYGIWIILLVLTILISLTFDVRDVALVFLGTR